MKNYSKNNFHPVITVWFLIINFYLLGWPVTSEAQVNQDWAKTFNGKSDSTDVATDVAVDANGNVYVTGYSYSSASDFDIFLIKYDGSGAKIWSKKYNGPGNSVDQGVWVGIDGNGEIYEAGSSTGSGTGLDFVVIKYDANGNRLWVKRYDGPANGLDVVVDGAIDNANNVHILGTSTKSGTGKDLYTIKYNSSGVKLWSKRFSNSGDDDAAAIAVDASQNVYIDGCKYENGSDHNHFCTLKYNASGVLQWSSDYSGMPLNGFNMASDIAVDNAGNVYVTGSSLSQFTGIDFATIKYDTNGDSLWVTRYNGYQNGVDEPTGMVVDNSGNVYVTGNSFYPSTGFDMVTVKYASNGLTDWIDTLSNPGDDDGDGIDIDSLGETTVVGCRFENGSEHNIKVVHYNSSGTRLWDTAYANANSSGTNMGNAVCSDADGIIYVTGFIVKNENNDEDMLTIKYSPSFLDLRMGKTEEANYLVYPNPLSKYDVLRFFAKDESKADLNIFDLSGKLIFSKQGIPSGEKIGANRNFSEGFYLVEIRDDGQKYFLKLVIQ